MAEFDSAERVSTYLEEYDTDVMTGDRNKRMYLYYQLVNSMKKADRIDIIVSFLMESGVKMLLKNLDQAMKRGAKIRILTGNYLGITQPSALYLIKHELGENVDLRFYSEKGRSFHPKSYIFHYADHSDIYIGSSNISKSALTSGIEWNYRFSSRKDPITLFDKYDICAVFYIGGNDSMDTIAKLSRYGQQVGSSVRFIGVPKTIDNDLCLTDHTPGYGSAAKYIATILKEVIRDSSVYNIRSVTVAEIMGRHAGWLAGAACLAGGEDCEGPDLILLPEVPFDQDKFLARVDELQRVKSNVIIAASEGVKTADGTYLCDLVSTAGQLDAFGHKAILSGTSRYLSELIHDKLQCKSRAIEFSTLQRCASHLASRTDVNEAYAVGGAAAAAAFAGESGRMIALKRVSNYPYQCITESVDVQQVANLEKKVPLEWITSDGMQVTEAFEEYARPLILDEVTPVYVNGTPRHIRL